MLGKLIDSHGNALFEFTVNFYYTAGMENLDQEVKTLLKDRKGDFPAISKAAGVSYSWLSKFNNGHIGNPGYGTLKKLHTTLKAHVLAVAPVDTAGVAMENEVQVGA